MLNYQTDTFWSLFVELLQLLWSLTQDVAISGSRSQNQIDLPSLCWLIHNPPTIPSGKLLHNYGKSPFLMGKSTINGHFSIATLNYQRVHPWRESLIISPCFWINYTLHWPEKTSSIWGIATQKKSFQCVLIDSMITYQMVGKLNITQL